MKKTVFEGGLTHVLCLLKIRIIKKKNRSESHLSFETRQDGRVPNKADCSEKEDVKQF